MYYFIFDSWYPVLEIPWDMHTQVNMEVHDNSEGWNATLNMPMIGKSRKLVTIKSGPYKITIKPLKVFCSALYTNLIICLLYNHYILKLLKWPPHCVMTTWHLCEDIHVRTPLPWALFNPFNQYIRIWHNICPINKETFSGLLFLYGPHSIMNVILREVGYKN